MRLLGALLLLASLPAAAQKTFSRETAEHSNAEHSNKVAPQKIAPYVASPQPIVDRMLDMAAIKPGELVYDLGCGDGRILITAAQKYKARAVGIELSERLFQMTLMTVRQQNLTDQIMVRHGNLLDVNLSDADVVTLYLETGSNDTLRPNLERFLRDGARVVSHDFEVRGWTPVQVDKMRAWNRNHTIYLYHIPASLTNSARRKAKSSGNSQALR